MRLGDRVSLKTITGRFQSIAYEADEVLLGARGGAVLLQESLTVESIAVQADCFVGFALSKSPGHLDNPPGSIEEWMTSEALYGRLAISYSEVGAEARYSAIPTIHLPMHELLVPNRQVACWIVINSSNLTGIAVEIQYKVAHLSQTETNLLNINWGKYRR